MLSFFAKLGKLMYFILFDLCTVILFSNVQFLYLYSAHLVKVHFLKRITDGSFILHLYGASHSVMTAGSIYL